MIKIIKKGSKEFLGICKMCGCVFSYTLSDVNYGNALDCPFCKSYYYHETRPFDKNEEMRKRK